MKYKYLLYFIFAICAYYFTQSIVKETQLILSIIMVMTAFLITVRTVIDIRRKRRDRK